MPKAQVMQQLRSILTWFRQALCPHKCLVCRREGVVLCDQHDQLPAAILPPLDMFKPLDGLYAVTDYHYPASRALVKFLKFHRHRAPGCIMAEHLQFLVPWERWPQATVVPLPLHWWRGHQRGFNQSALLGRAAADFLNLDYDHQSFRRLKLTRQQAKLSKAERAKNMNGAFAWCGPDPGPPIVILIDDVCTTGSTLKAAAKALKKAGAVKVIGVVFAYQSLN